MTPRTTSRTATFSCPFKLSGMECEHPAGSYTVGTNEELLEGLSFPAYRRTATCIVLPGPSRSMIQAEIVRVDPFELQAALDRVALIDGAELTVDFRPHDERLIPGGSP
jgi:hypothetical protein